MKTINKAFILVLSTIILMSCGSGKKEKQGAIGDKKVQLEKLKNERAKIDEKIATLEKEIAKLDTGFSDQKAKLVSISPIEKVDFVHYLTLQGFVDQQNVSYATPTGQPGQIKAIYVKQGDKVHKGQLLLKLDNSVAMENVNAIRQQANSVKAQLELARSVYNRQKNLWEHNIGTEVQLLQAKTNVETLEGQLKTIQANVNAASTQANQSNVYSDVNGTVDEVTAHVGETFNGNPMTGGYIKIVTNGEPKIKVTVPESYAGRVSKGSKVEIELPDTHQTFEGTISFLSQTIGATTRGFTAEIKVPSNINVRPNQTAVVKIIDYRSNNTIAIPLNTIQNDENGKYVMIAVNKNGEMIAEKKPVQIGQFNNDSVEVKQGLKPGEMLVTEGYQGVFEGEKVTTSEK